MDDIDYISDELLATKTAHTRKSKGGTVKHIRVRSSVEKARDDMRRAKRLQRDNIRRARQQIRSYKLLKKQAKTTYKLIKLANK